MTISEIKELTRFLKDEDVENIKKEIKSKEDILKGGNIEEQEIIQVLNTLFAILVIEKTLDSEIEEVENIRDMLEQELLESYQVYDSYMDKCKKEEKKKKKRWWLLDFLFLSDRIHIQKEGIGASNKLIANLKNDLDNIKEQKSDSNLKEVVSGRDKRKFNEFCKHPVHYNKRDRSSIEIAQSMIKRELQNLKSTEYANGPTNTKDNRIAQEEKIKPRSNEETTIISIPKKCLKTEQTIKKKL